MAKQNPMSKALVRRETIAGYAFMLPSLFRVCGLSDDTVCLYKLL